MVLLPITIIFALYGSSQCQEKTYLVTGPRIWRVGASETVSVQAFGLNQNLAIRISVVSYPDKKTKYASQHLELNSDNNYQGLINLMIQTKDLPRKSNTEQYVYLEAQSNLFTKEEKVLVTYDNGFLFIQTDKPIYTPDQSVKIRVYSMDEELRPARRTVTITIKDPEGVNVDIMGEKDLTGIISFPDFKIPFNPKYGIWKIHASYENDFTTTTKAQFEVKEYVLPKFIVSIQPENNFICYDTFENFKITVKARYLQNQKFDRARAYMRFGIIQDGVRRLLPKSIQVSMVTEGETHFYFNSKKGVEELGYSDLEELDGSHLYITVSVAQPSGGHTEESENVEVKYVLTPYTLKLVATPLFVKPTLPYYITVQLRDTSDIPVGNIPVTLSGEMLTEHGESLLLNEDKPDIKNTDREGGKAVFIVNIPSHVVSLEFTVKTSDPSLPDANQASSQYTAKAYKSLTKSYLYINWQNTGLRVGQFLNVQLVPSSPYLAKVNHYSYLVLSKGKILKSGTVATVSGASSQSLNLEITDNMIPSVRLLVYYIITGDTTAELIADSIWVDLDDKCVNNQKVQLLANKKDFKPGKDMSLTLKAQTNSLVALSAVDLAIYEVTRKSKRPFERVLRKIEESDLGCGAGAGEDNADVFRLAGLTFLTNANIRAAQDHGRTCTDILRAKRSVDFDAEIKQKVNKFNNSRSKQCCFDGVKCFLADKDCTAGINRTKNNKKKPCVDAFAECCAFAQRLKKMVLAPFEDTRMGRMYLRTVFDIEEPEVRSYFPESWLWEEHTITDRYGSKTLSVKLPDSLTSWEFQGIGMSEKGMCVADPLTISIWKDLFVDIQLPYSVVRGEQIQLKAVVYNFQNSQVKGCVTVSVGKEICLFGVSSTHRRGGGMVCSPDTINGQSLKTFTFTILPLELGLHTINFTLTVPFHSEILVKTLRVVPEGIKGEKNVGFTLDPQAIRGITKRRQDIAYKFPPNIVPKSKVHRTLSLRGKILGGVMDTVLNGEGVNYLISLPKGSAETELMRVVPIFYVYHYLEATKQWSILGSSTLLSKIELERKMKEGINSILAFQNADFSYSVWRDSDPSTWLTAFAVRIFAEIHNYVSVDHVSVCNTLTWLVENCQLRDGSFEDKSPYQPIKLQGKLPTEAREKSMYLTAYVLISLSKANRICPIMQVQESINMAEEYLSNNVGTAQSTYTLAITGYALSQLDILRYGVRSAATKLKGEAYNIGVGDNPVYRFWKDTLKKFDPTSPSAETARMVETTAYALMTFLKTGEIEYSQPVVKWLQEQQRYGGGFFSTQDTAIALEALTEVAFLEKKLNLNMAVKVAYRKLGDFQQYQLTEKMPFTRPLEVPLNDDLVISTQSAYGLATGNIRTVYHLISPSEENCNFDIRIRKKDYAWDEDLSIFDDDTSHLLRLEACARYRPKDNEITTASHTVMEISMLTGLEADEKELHDLTTRVDQFVTDYSIEEGRVILHFDWISSDEYICATILVREMFTAKMLTPGTFKVYEFHAPEQQCTMFYSPYEEKRLTRLCTGDECRCMEAECPTLQTKMNQSITADQRTEKACRSDATYAYKVEIVESLQDGNFVKYTATILDIINTGAALVKVNKKITFIKKKTCSDFELLNGDQFLVMGKDGFQIRVGFDFKYEYPLDPSTWIEWWPQKCDSPDCNIFSATLDEFSENVLLNGC
ncbi:complement C5 isoform 2-T2 [Pelodytes ibericus]